ncbi:MAG: endonuclease/exonuclease/phosphatase family protein [Marinomonas sp.]|uniref:endonuclease/exonuclease/phosphatase family protein n=1 Tax=Marinomonas sp. TaxID=1904862 RepID=UPI003F99FB65
MRLLSWNIQSAKGCDHIFDITRIIKDIQAFGDLDVICLQEVSRHMLPYNNDDQKCLIEESFPNYHSAWAPGFSRPLENGKSQEFGNLTLVKHGKLLDQRIHQLPNPCVSPSIQIPRTMVETVIQYKGTNITLMNTHLAYHSELESEQQIECVTQLREQIRSHTDSSMTSSISTDNDAYHTAQKGQHILLCGDLNIALNSAKYIKMTQDMAWLDSAEIALNNASSSIRQPTCGLFDTDLWPEGPHVRDYFLCSASLHDRIKNFEVNTSTMASDHQPICLTLED